jgi:hypothetical protein
MASLAGGSSGVPADMAVLTDGSLGSSSVYPQSALVGSGTRRPYASALEYAVSSTERTLHRRPAAASMPFALGRAYPPSVYGTPAYMSSGDSLSNAALSEPSFAAVMARPDKGAFATSFDDYEPIWNCVGDTKPHDPGFSTVASLQKLNALLELSTALYANAGNVQRRVYASQLAESARDVGRKYKLLGPTSSPPEYQRAALASGYSGPQEMLVPYVVNGRALVHNLFGEHVRPGATVYFVASGIKNPYSAFLQPNGGVLAIRSASGFAVDRLLQVRGVSDTELGGVVSISSRRALSPDDGDSWYLRAGARIAQMTRIVEYDEFTGLIRIVNVAEQEGLQEARDGASEVVTTLIEQPHVVPFGVVLRNYGADASRAELDLAHRVRSNMLGLGQLEVLLNAT